MKNFLKILLLATMVLWVACSDDKKGWNSDAKELTIGKLTVVTAVRGDTAIAETITDFFLEDDQVEFRYSHAGASPVVFTCDMTDGGWSDLSKAVYYSHVYSKQQELESFVAEYGTEELTTDQSTEEKYHFAHHLKGDVYVKNNTYLIRADSMVNQHVKVIVKIQKSSKWSGSSDFQGVMNKEALTIHTSAGNEVRPFYDDSQDNYAIYSAILPVNMVPGEGSALFSIKGKSPISYTFVSGSESPVAGQTLLINARYDNVNQPSAIAMTKNVWDTFKGMPYGYPLVEEIYNLDDVDILAASVSSGVDYTDTEVRLMNDLDLEYELVAPIGTQNNPFNGTFLGGGKTVSRLAVKTEEVNAAFFGSVGVDGTVKDLNIVRANIESTQNYASVVTGSNYGYIVNCQTTECEVTGYNYVASIVGYNEGIIVGCGLNNDAVYTLKASEAVAGGITGYNYKRIVACKALPNTVQVTRTSGNKFGALVGEAPVSATIDRCSWEHGSLSALGAGGYNKEIKNSSSSEMNQAIGEYNAALDDEKKHRTCSKTW